MKGLVALVLALPAAGALAAKAYVTDQLVLTVYAQSENRGAKLAVLHSGAAVETLSSSDGYTEVSLADGTRGWVNSTYLTNLQPASARVEQLEAELAAARAVPAAMAAAAAESEAGRLRSQLDALRASSRPAQATLSRAARGLLVAGVGAAFALGFWLGHALLARRVRHKFGGLKLY